MTATRLKTTIRRFRYKPDWRFRLEESSFDSGYFISITADVQDSGHPSRKPADPPRSYVYVSERKLAAWKTKDVIDRVADAVQRLENHEFGEWFRYRGRRPFDPHV